jgi:LPS-assembly protein
MTFRSSGRQIRDGSVATRSLACALGLALSAALSPGLSLAQNVGASIFGEAKTDPNAKMLLEADQLVYNQDENTVAAVGGVRIAYNGYTLVARRVTYSRTSGRVIAAGDVEIVEPNGSRIFAEEIDITDDFRDGFVTSLRVETADNTRFAAESAERRDGEIAVFNNGVYTACEPCLKDPAKPPLWQIRANRVIINNATRRVEYEGASFELFGKPIAWLPRFSHADPAIKRQTGFLVPEPSYTENLGIVVRNSFFWAPAPNYDLTLSGTYTSNQGFLGEAEWRHRTFNGEYNLRIAGIQQQNPTDFGTTKIDSAHEERVAVMSAGRFELNPRWTFGWNGLWQSDENFARTYNLRTFNTRDVTNQVYLTGLAGKNHFDIRGQQFLVQDDLIDQDPLKAGNQKLQDQQGSAVPSLDLNRVSEESVAGGEISFDVNLRSIDRHDAQIVNDDALATQGVNERYHGIAGGTSRLSARAEWRRSEIYSGAVVTASLSGQADGVVQDTDALASATNPLLVNESLVRGMPAGMLEIRYPMIASDGYATHLFEPVAQVIARPNETGVGSFTNEDAQSFVFDTTNLFERDKFSGYDRVEGGTRANVGFRYSASFLNGASLNLAFGESFHIAGQNSFAAADLVNAGLESGLETDRSDFVGAMTLNNGHGFSVGLGGRFNETNFELRRGELSTRYASPALSLAGSYVFIAPQPNYGYAVNRHEVNGSASMKLTENWRGFGSFSMDLEADNLYRHGLGLAYDDSCFSFSVAYDRVEDRYTGDPTDTSLTFRLGLRTIGDYSYKYSLEDAQ